MSRRIYLLLVLVRLYFALSPSYIHPDEHFQGPEIIAGEIFGWPTYKTWEFVSAQPIRSIFPLKLIYAPALIIFKWLCTGIDFDVTPIAVFYVLRLLMFLLSFVLQDWALHELLPDRQQRSTALFLVASSYVTWTYQMHTFSNSIETIIVLWCLVLMRRMQHDQDHTQATLCIALAFLAVLGVFNRITFPAFLIAQGIELLPHLWIKPMRLPILAAVAALTTLLAIAMDTEYYSGEQLRLRQIFSNAIITPLNNLTYNLDSSNLAQHGVHPYWQHFVANLPQLIGPIYPLVFLSSRKQTLFWSGIGGVAVLSCFKHQEARFLLPAIPLILSSIKYPKRYARVWTAVWMGFNILAAIVFGTYHQAGIVPVQSWLSQQQEVAHVLWWKTYSPPRWLLGSANHAVNTTDLMGMSGKQMIEEIFATSECYSMHNRTLLVAPSSAEFLDEYKVMDGPGTYPENFIPIRLLHHHQQHIGLDDLDFGEDGMWNTLYRATLSRFPEADHKLAPQTTIENVFAAVQSGTVSQGVVPFENSTNGSVVFTLDLFVDLAGRYPDILVSGEVYLPVHHCLFGRAVVGDNPHNEKITSAPAPACDLKAIKTLYSHPQAWSQCSIFLSTHFDGTERRNATSTSQAAEIVAEDPSDTSAAISGRVAGELNGLDLLAENIEDKAGNSTRFFVLRKQSDAIASTHGQTRNDLDEARYKTLVSFAVAYAETGTLADCLAVFKKYASTWRSYDKHSDTEDRHNLNLTSINSRPSNESAWQYIFLVEFIGRKLPNGDGAVNLALKELGQVAQSWRWLGSWENALTS
ncbi:hypothetical protein LTR62_007020 [Meristemomyces frigidus]|uniref:Mannosyltransferase n=1 Tax=Meristemomyces frigidus TaxID=1508187 RepID=A0AAN7TFA5_9PEZI|nr:hypothetical protein LTR62_007020 [Meristemomyces frigidus]